MTGATVDLPYAQRLLDAADGAASRGRPEAYRFAAEALEAVAGTSWPMRAAVADVALAARNVTAGDDAYARYRVASDRAHRALAGCAV